MKHSLSGAAYQQGGKFVLFNLTGSAIIVSKTIKLNP
jgi:hypothetical protein